MMWNDAMGWGYGWGLHGIGGLLMLGLLVWLVLAVSRRNDDAPPDRSLAILKERYARGEISRDEFTAMRRELEAP